MPAKQNKPKKTEEKAIPRYDRKLQKRKEEEAKEKKQRKINLAVGIAIVALIIGFAASFPIRTLIAVNQSFFTVNGEKVAKVEFDYHYNSAISNYYTQYGSYLSYFGLDITGDLSTQMYTETMTWQDFFEEMAVDSIRQSKALIKEANKAGFQYNTAEEWEEFNSSMKEFAANEGTTVSRYLRFRYGSYATMSRLRPHVEENIFTAAYYRHLMEEKAPTDEVVQSYYEENKDAYDSVDYRLIVVEAELPTEPTELADTPEDNEDNGEDYVGEVLGEPEEIAYQPSEAEIEEAMKIAREKAEEEEAAVATEGELHENVLMASVNYNISEWLFDESRTAGDTTIIEDSYSHLYYVVSFAARYRDASLSADARIIVTTADGQAILDEWTNGPATEESFIELHEKYDEEGAVTGGLFTGLTKSSLPEELAEWMFAENRKSGDTAVITPEGSNTFVIYYVAQGEPEWKLSIQNTLLSEVMAEYMEEIKEEFKVEDPKGRLNYLTIQEVQALEEE